MVNFESGGYCKQDEAQSLCRGVEYCERHGSPFFEVVAGNNWGSSELSATSALIGVEGPELYSLRTVLRGMKTT